VLPGAVLAENRVQLAVRDLFMKKVITSVLLPITMLVLSSIASAQTKQDESMCKYSAEYMIDIAKQSLSDKNSRPKRIEKRARLVEQWTSRMESGEDPCAVYADIQKQANTF
jgi:hypothetical protein